MTQQYGQRPQSEVARCYRHPDRETWIGCARCGRPICPSCMIVAAVGHQCPECVHGAQAARVTRATRPRTPARSPMGNTPPLVTSLLLAVNLVVFLAVLAGGDRVVTDYGMVGYATDGWPPHWIGVADGEWYRLLTAAFLHQAVWHIAFNMLGLWFLGPPLEAALGRVRFLALYLISALAGSTLFYLLAEQNELSLGASGAIFGLFGATVVLIRRLGQDMRPIAIVLAINLVITFTASHIAWQAHIGGLVAGTVVTAGLVQSPRRGRLTLQVASFLVVLAALVVACAIRTSELVGG